MVTISKHSLLILTCITLLPRTHTADSFKAAGLCAAFGVILPTAIGIGTRYMEKHFNIDNARAWSSENHLDLEASKAINTAVISGISLLTWSILRGTVMNDMRISFVLSSIYAYAQGRALFMERQSKLQRNTSFLLPCAIGVLAYSRIADLAPQLDLAGKSILVLGLAHYGA